jgi:hypothetical protein
VTEKVIIGAEEAVRLLRFEVFEKGADHVYSNPEWDTNPNSLACYNFHDRQPGCIIGHVLNRLGYTYEMAKADSTTRSAGVWDTTRAAEAHEEFGFKFNDWGLRVLSKAQALQDERQSWGEALEGAEAEYRDFLNDQALQGE